VGSGPLVAQSYADESLAYTTYKPWQLIGLSMLIWTLGIIGELFVPKLPLNIPRREFGVYSWLALFQSQAREFRRVPCIRANQPLIFRSCSLRRLVASISSGVSMNWRKHFQTSESSSSCRETGCQCSGLSLTILLLSTSSSYVE